MRTFSLTSVFSCDADQIRYRSPIGQLPRVQAHTSEAVSDHIPLGGFVLERAQMANYRIVTIDQAGKLGRHRGFVCDNDDDAIVRAKQSVEDTAVELWSGPRFIARLEPRSST
jgi:hypothetical protein